MKRFLLSTILLWVGIIFAYADNETIIEVISQDEKSIILKCSLYDYNSNTVSTNTGEAVIISLNDGTQILNVGAPDLPKLTTSLIIPDQSHMSVLIESVEFTDYENIEVAPSKGNLYRDVNPSTIPYTYGPEYDANEFYPKEIAKLRDPYIFRNYRGQTVVINPVAYNPITKTLRVYSEIILKVVESPGPIVNPFTPKSNVVVKEFDLLYNERFLNYSNQNTKYPELEEFGDMLIISAPEYIDQLQPFVTWKNQKGIKTNIVDVTTIGNTPASIKNYVNMEYQSTNLTYLLLVGDEVAVVTDKAVNNNACDHCYGQLEGEDHFLELFVGRFNGENTTHIQTMIDRTMEYENNPIPGDWYTTAIGVASNLGPGNDDEFDFEHLNKIKEELLNYNYENVFEFYEGSNTDASPTPDSPTVDAPGNPNSQMILDVLNTRGASLFNYTGHGDHSVLFTGNFDNEAVDAITRTGSYPLMIAVACCVGDFQNDFGAGDCFGDRWQRATDDNGNPIGGIAGFFSSILQTWAPPMEGQDEMSKLITESAQYNIKHTIGGIYVHGCGSMIDEYGADGESMTNTWNIFGDPSVVLRTQNPENIEVSHIPVAFLGETELSFTCDVEGAIIGLYYQDEVIGTGVVEGGNVTIEFESVTFPEMIKVTATAYNHYPYQGVIDVILADGPFVLLNEYAIQDPTGNANNEIDFGETINLDVALKNVGIELSPNVTANISTTNEAITLLDINHIYGDIAIEEELLENAAFSFEVDALVVDQSPLLLNVDIADDNGNEWSQNIELTINAPVLSTLDFEIDDTVNGNGNSRFDNGETIEVRIPVVNNGHANSPNAISTLSTTSPYLTITPSTFDLGILNKNGGLITATYIIQVDDNAPATENFQLIHNTTASAYATSRIYESGLNLIVEDFESDDFENFDWISEGAASWFTTTLLPVSGTYCAQSGLIENNEASEMLLTTEVLENGNIVFNRKVSSEINFDLLQFYIDNVLMEEWSGELPWEEVAFPVTAGMRTFKWVYVKDFAVSGGDDAAWIDEVVLPISDIEVNTADFIANEFSLAINPNPFYNTSNLSLELQKETTISISIFNVTGQRINQLVANEILNEGHHIFEINGVELPSGIYFIQVQLDNQSITRKLIKQ